MKIEVGTQLGAYEVEALIGEGGMAVVARARGEDGPVALKVLTSAIRAEQPGAIDRLRREADVLQELAAVPGVVGFVEQFRLPDDGPDVLVLEYIDGVSLQSFVGKHLAIRQIVEWMGHACHALYDMHQAGFVHRDLKPDNLMLVDDPERPLRLIDFNSAGAAQAVKGRLTRAQGTFPYTPAFLAPECFDGVPADASADVYALGISFAELLLGHHPLVPSGKQEPTRNRDWQNLHEEVAFPDLTQERDDVPAALAAVFRDATAKDREQRIPDAVVLWERLKSVWSELEAAGAVAAEPVAAERASGATRSASSQGSPASAGWLVPAIGGLGVLLLLGGGGFLAQQWYELSRAQADLEAKEQRIRAEQQAREEEERQRAEKERLAREEEEAARRAEEERLAEQERRQQAERDAEEARQEEAARRAEEARQAELAQKRAEEQRQAAREQARPVPSGPPVLFKGNRYVFVQPLQFYLNKGTLKPESDPILAELARLVNENGHRISIGVHSDSMGNATYNLKLTQQRADEVKRRLAALGVPSGNLAAVGYGAERPIAVNNTAAGRAKNRRVEILIR